MTYLLRPLLGVCSRAWDRLADRLVPSPTLRLERVQDGNPALVDEWMRRYWERGYAVDRCSADRPCNGVLWPDGNPLHRLLWGECYIEVVHAAPERAG